MEILKEDLVNTYNDLYVSPDRTDEKQARVYSESVGGDFLNTFNNEVSVSLSISGVLVGSPPVPYGPVVVVPEYIGIYDVQVLGMQLYKIIELFKGNTKTARPLKAARKEANVVMDAIEGMFLDTNSQGRFALTMDNSSHVGAVTGVFLPSVALRESFASQLLAIVYSWVSNNRTIAKNISSVIESILKSWLSSVTFTGAATLSPAGPLSPGVITGVYISS